MTHATQQERPAPPSVDTRRWLALAVILAAPFMAIFDQFVVNVAIPTVQNDLHANFAQVQLVLAGYALAYAVTLITGGRLGDIYGRKRLFMLGMIGFTVASALCGFAPGPGLLVGARIVQGFSAALMSPQVLSIIQVTFPAEERSAALSIYGAVIGLGSLAGQALGGFLIRANPFGLSWRVVFLVNLPIGIAALIAATFLLGESRAPVALRLDLGGVVIITSGLFLLTYPLVAGRDAGWPLWTWLCLIAAVVTIAVFVRFERWKTERDGSPLVVLSLFRARGFDAGLIVAFLYGAANAAMFFTLALYLQIGLHFSPLAAGLTFAPAPIGFFTAATLCARFVPRLGSYLVLFGVMLKAVAWSAIAVIVHSNGTTLHGTQLLPLLFAEGFAAGATNPPLIGSTLIGIRSQDAGSASGLYITCQQIAGAIGVAIIGVIFFGALANHAPTVSARLAPDLQQQLTTASLPVTAISATLTDYQTCANDRGKSRDPAITPPSCQTMTLQPSDPAVQTTLAASLNHANAQNYADAYVIALICNVATLIVAFVVALALPTPRRVRP